MQIYLPLAEMSVSAPLLLAMGLSVGLLSGLFGIGGGFILTPLLIFMGVPPSIAVGTGTSQVIASSVSGALGHWRRGNVDVEIGGLLIAGGLIGATAGVWLQRMLKAAGQLDTFIAAAYVVLLGTIGTLMLIESVNTIRRAAATPVGGTRRTGPHHTWLQGLPLKRRFAQSKLYMSMIPPIAIGAGVGLLTSIMGIGGGFVLIPALIYLIRMPTRLGIGTSTFQIIFVTAYASVLQAVANHSVDIMLGLPLMIGGVIGAQYGVRIGELLKVEQLRLLLALLVIAVAIRMATTLAIEPSDIFVLDVVKK